MVKNKEWRNVCNWLCDHGFMYYSELSNGAIRICVSKIITGDKKKDKELYEELIHYTKRYNQHVVFGKYNRINDLLFQSEKQEILK